MIRNQNIDAHSIMDDAYVFACDMLKQKLQTDDKKLSVDVLKGLFISPYQKTVVENLILGAIISYHDQLRDILITKGIDIGEMSPGTGTESD